MLRVMVTRCQVPGNILVPISAKAMCKSPLACLPGVWPRSESTGDIPRPQLRVWTLSAPLTEVPST